MVAKYKKALVEIIWNDAETTHGWETDEEVDVAEVPIVTVGFLIRRTEHLVVVASSIDQDTGNQSNGRIKIPVEMITNIKVLSTPPVKRSKSKLECPTPVDPVAL